MPEAVQSSALLSIESLNAAHAIQGSVEFRVADKGLVSAKLAHSSGTSTELFLHGAHVHSLKIAGVERLFMSGACLFDGKSPLRGGIPLVGPVFGPSEEFGLHGFLRTTQWKVENTSVDGDGNVSIKLVPNLGAAQNIHKNFINNVEFSYIVTLKESGIELALKVNNKSATDFEMKAAGFHTYFNTDPLHTTIDGLPNQYLLSADPTSEKITREAGVYKVSPSAETKHLYPQSNMFRLGTSNGELSIASNFFGVVIWKPGLEQEFPDLERTDKGFVCGESIMFTPEIILAGCGREYRTKIEMWEAA